MDTSRFNRGYANDGGRTTYSSERRVRNTALRQTYRQSTGPSRSVGMASRQEHYDGGEYEFNGIVLSWQPETFQSRERLKHLDALPTTHSDSDDYYNSFMPHIIEETWGMLKQGMEKPSKSFKLTLRRSANLSKKEGNPSNFTARGRLPDDVDEGASGLILLLSYMGRKFLGLTSIDKKNQNQLRIKFIANEQMRHEIESKERWLQKDAYLYARVLGSIVTQRRMYAVCKDKPQPRFLDNLISGNLRKHDRHDNADAEFISTDLNTSQQNAIKNFLRRRKGMHLIQGPPGTGKTTTIVSLLQNLVQQKDKTLVCAPSNKAVQVLVERFHQQSPDTPIILAGVEQKVPEHLQPVFLHAWPRLVLSKLNNLLDIQARVCRSIEKTDVKTCIPKKRKNLAKNIFDNLKKMRNIAGELQAEIHKSLPNSKMGSLITLIQQYQYLLEALRLPIKIIDHINEDDLKNIQTAYEPGKFAQLRSPLTSLQAILQGDRTELEKALLKNAKLVFCTLSTAGRSQMKDLKVKSLVIDEAAQCVEAETLIPFSFVPKRCLLVGDTNQLPATVISKYAEKRGYGISMMSRLIEGCRQSADMLNVQYRMHPGICAWPSKQYYDNRLQDGENVTARPSLLGEGTHPLLLAPCLFINVESRETRPKQSHSIINQAEVKAVENLLRYLQKNMRDQPNSSVGVITFYAAQAKLLEEKLDRYPNVRVSTVDGFQGDENDIIIISCVRANPNNNIGFVEDFRRLNVAITRAKDHLFIVGHQATLVGCDGDIGILVNDLVRQEQRVDYESIFGVDKLQSKNRKQSRANTSKGVMPQPRSNLNRNKAKNQNKGSAYKYKSQFCRFFKQGNCNKGKTCTYAHSNKELRAFNTVKS